MRDDSLAEQAIDCFGFDHQELKCAEETLELALAIVRKILDPSPERIQEVIDETADALIVLDQQKVRYGHSVIAAAKCRKEKKLFRAIEVRRGSGQEGRSV